MRSPVVAVASLFVVSNVQGYMLAEIVLLFLHGYQATAEELVPLAHALERVVSPHRAIQVLLPQAPGGCWWSDACGVLI